MDEFLIKIHKFKKHLNVVKGFKFRPFFNGNYPTIIHLDTDSADNKFKE